MAVDGITFAVERGEIFSMLGHNGAGKSTTIKMLTGRARPTAGLDPASAHDVRALIRDLSQAGTTVFLTTHYMEEADELSDRVAFLAHGRIVALDTPRELKLRYGKKTAAVLLEDRSESVINLNSAEDAARMESWMRNGQVLTVHSQEGTLEDVFIALAGRSLQ